jgi:hypothetical protein
MAPLPKTVQEILDEMHSYWDVGVSLAIQRAIEYAIGTGALSLNADLTSESLEKIRQSIYDTNDSDRGATTDPMIVLAEAMFSSYSPASKSGNSTEKALQYIENLQNSRS